MAKQTKKQAVEKRTQQRLAARKEAAERGVETRRRHREAREHPPVAPQAAEPQAEQPQAPKRLRKRPQRTVAQDKPAADRGAPARPGMATVALRGESAQRFRALAEKEGLTLAKLLARMMEVFEARDK